MALHTPKDVQIWERLKSLRERFLFKFSQKWWTCLQINALRFPDDSTKPSINNVFQSCGQLFWIVELTGHWWWEDHIIWCVVCMLCGVPPANILQTVLYLKNAGRKWCTRPRSPFCFSLPIASLQWNALCPKLSRWILDHLEGQWIKKQRLGRNRQLAWHMNLI